MAQKTDISETSQHKLTRVLEQMDSWRSHNSRLILSIHSPLFHLTLPGRIVGRLKRLFMFDTYGETCRIAVIPEQYDRIIYKQQVPSVTFETSGMAGERAEAMWAEICVDWVASKMFADAAHQDHCSRNK
jgi:hypothetical protein